VGRGRCGSPIGARTAAADANRGSHVRDAGDPLDANASSAGSSSTGRRGRAARGGSSSTACRTCPKRSASSGCPMPKRGRFAWKGTGRAPVTVEPPSWRPARRTSGASLPRLPGAVNIPAPHRRAGLYWTVVGSDRDAARRWWGRIGERGAVQGGFLIEPVLLVNGRKLTWATSRRRTPSPRATSPSRASRGRRTA